MVRGGCLLIRGSERMAWKYDDDCYGCGGMSKQKNMCCLNATRYGEERGRWIRVIKIRDGMHGYDVIKRYQLKSDEIEKKHEIFLE